MSKMRFSFFQWSPVLAVFLLMSAACHVNKTKEVRSTDLKDYVFVVNIVPDTQKLKEYLDYHAHIWPEVEAGFRKAGYKKISLYRHDYLLVMTLTVPSDADLGQMGKLAESYDKRCADWNQLMNGYQTGVAGTKPDEKWVEAKPFYRFVNE
jgi:L-rhamnose mutarotase